MSYTRPENGHCSDLFMDSFMGGGGPHVECDCGILHLAVDSSYQDYETVPPESDEVRHHFAVDCVTYFELNGRIFCRDCDGCKKSAFKYEHFFWNYRSEFRRYLKVRIDQEKAWAEQEHLMNILAGISNE